MSGISLSPNNLYTVAMERTIFHRQQHPYPSECKVDWDSSKDRLSPALQASVPYNAALCQSFCIDQQVQVLTTV